MKKCSKCKEQKDFSEFYKNKSTKDGFANACKSCQNQYVDQYRKNDKEKESNRYKKYYQDNKEKIKEYKKQYYKDNKEQIVLCSNQYRKNNEEKISQIQKEYRQNNKEKIKEYRKQYYEDNKEKLSQFKLDYKNDQYRNNPNVRLASIIRTRINDLLYGYIKEHKEIGLNFKEFKKYIMAQWTDGMEWANYGRKGWVIGFIDPISSFDLTNKQAFLMACNFTNLKPMWMKDTYGKHK